MRGAGPRRAVESAERTGSVGPPSGQDGRMRANAVESRPAACASFPLSRFPAVNVATVPQRSPLRYPGGKTWLIPHIREWLSHSQARVLIEPFAGGGTVSLTAVMEKLVDQAVMVERDHDVAAFWHTVLQDGTQLAEQVQQFTPTRELVSALEQSGVRGVADHAFRTLVLNRTKRAGILAPGASFNKAGENQKGIVSRWYPDTLAVRLRAIEEHAEHITFFEGDGMRLLEPLLHGWGQEAVAFLDPPYTAAGGKQAGSRLYAHNTIDHAALFAVLARSRSSFLMTYDGAPEIVELIQQHGFQAVRVEMKNAHHNRLPELVITRERVFS